MKRVLALGLHILLLSACSSSNDCDSCDANACMTCNDDNKCVFTCDTGMTCDAGTCMAPAVASCDPACGPCQSCDTSGETPVCVDSCAPGLVCNDGTCEAPACNPLCGSCEKCDTSGDTYTCVPLCDEGLECQNGLCVFESACTPTCGPCEICDSTSGTPTCVGACDVGQMCSAVGTCVRAGTHSRKAQLQGPFATGPEVTEQCLKCHEDVGGHMLSTTHWNWQGTAPGAGGATMGKITLVNNFCTGVASNWPRCTSCHVGYGWEDDTFDFSDPSNIDCLICHADPASGYAKAPPSAGRPVEGVDLALAAQSVGKSTRANCGKCHFNGGGGDNIKMGDLGSAMTNPSIDADVHMGSGFTCATCHAGPDHTFKGTGVHLPVSEGDLACTDCHKTDPHGAPLLNNHALDIACQTCHIPAFSRQQPTKVEWDWSTAGDRRIGDNGVETGVVVDETGNEHEVHTYDAKKGHFKWEMNVRPSYAWYDHNVDRLTPADRFTDGLGASAADPVVLAKPSATKADAGAKIYPFKVMVGKQPAHKTEHYMIIPNVFGPQGFWTLVPAADEYDADTVRQNWTDALDRGRKAAGGPAGTIEDIGADDWEFVHTAMFLSTNHEVAPKSQALQCMDCHGNSEFDFRALGYTCDNPMTASNPAADCGVRHVQ